ncbi:MAG TPA: apolipoprotein N-acyltransferase, partial [Polyangiaceae bacterium]|nr:apolipoprotein N-acyltransferase [Polyangiaceae bacterium]
RAPSTAFVVAFLLSERFTPAVIPWQFAAALVDVPAALGLAPWLGPLGVSLVAVAGNASLLELVSYLRQRRDVAGGRAADESAARTRRGEAAPDESAARMRRPESAVGKSAAHPPLFDVTARGRAIVWAGVVLALAAFAWLAPTPGGGRGGAPVRVGVVQAPSVAGRGNDPSEAWQRLLSLHREARLRGATIVAWGEGALPFEPEGASLRDGEGAIYAAAFGGPTLVGAVILGGASAARPDASAAERALSNSVLAFSSAGLVGRYDKASLLPFSEYLPFEDRLPWLRSLSPASGRFRPGEGAAALRVAGQTLAPSVCFEDLFAGMVREAAAAPGVGLLFNATNDGWFGDTAEPWTHLAHARLRAAEHARPLVRAATTGPSALVDERGGVVALAEPFRDALLVAELSPRPGPPAPYTRWGDLAWVLTLAAAALRRRAPAPSGLKSSPSGSTS